MNQNSAFGIRGMTMFPINSSLVRIFQGNPIREPAEKQFLSLIIADLEAAKTPALVFMNFFAGPKRLQIDSLVITKFSVCVVEIKGYSSPVRGKYNGMWEIRKLREGNHVWEKIEGQNGYEETLAHKMALSDAMHWFASEKLPARRESRERYYKLLHACLCFVPDIPENSDLPKGDFKVAILGYRSGFHTVINRPLKPSWTFEEWEEFASWMSLEPVAVQNLWDESAGEINPLEQYQREFSSPERDKWVPTAIFDGEKQVGRESIWNCLLGAQSCLIEGPSGMGKSCLARGIAAEMGYADRLVIEFNAGYFNGNLEESLDDSVGAYVAATLNQLLAYGDAFGKKLVLLIDGWNECKADRRRLLAQQIDKMVNRHGATLLITSQFLPKEITTTLEIFKLGTLERADKLAIACLDESSESQLSGLIETIRTGIDAKIIGEIAGEIEGSCSRAELFDRFIRKRIGLIEPISTAVFDAMTLLAQAMHDRLSASLSVTHLHQLSAALGNTGSLIHSMERSGLFGLDHHRRHASFTHEQYQHFFAAWAIVRECHTASDLVRPLEMPRNMAIRTFILGLYAMIQSPSALGAILKELSTTDVLDDCLSGQCGPDLQAAAEELIVSSFGRVVPEISELMFVPYPTSFGQVKFGKFSRTWTPVERWAFGVVGKRLSQGDHINEFLNVAQLMDKRLESESKRLAGVHGKPNIFFKDVFAMVYVFNHPEAPGFTSIMSALRAEKAKSIYEQTVPHQSDVLDLLRSHQRLTRGQIYLLFELAILWTWDGALLEIMPDLIPDVWQKGPYHLRLQLMEVLRIASGYSDNETLKNKLANVLQELYSDNPFANSIITDVLTSLVELESSQTEDEYCSAIRRLLDTPDDTIAQELAYGYYFSQFDHPTDAQEVYLAIDSLSAEEKGNFLVMAAKAMKEYSFLPDLLLSELCTLLPPKAEPVFRKYCLPPDPQDTFFQEAVAKFLFAAIGLAQLRVEFPRYGPQSEISETWWAVGELFYWMNFDTENSEKKSSAIKALWDRLIMRVHSWPVVSFVLTDSSIRSRDRKCQMDLLPEFLDQIKLLASQQLKSFQSNNKANGDAHDVLHNRFRDPVASAISIFSRYGEAEDKEMLMRLIDDPDYGEEIVRALRNIRERGAGAST